jgi:tetratricopeptide (TPR) repeat protein
MIRGERWARWAVGIVGAAGLGLVLLLGTRNPSGPVGWSGAPLVPGPGSATELYDLGLSASRSGSAEGLARAIELFREALDVDPALAPAYAARAGAYVRLGLIGHLPPAEAFSKGKAAASAALQLDSGLAEAHAALGAYDLYYQWNREAADRSFRRARELDPGSTTIATASARIALCAGEPLEAEALLQEALRLDRLDPIAHLYQGDVYLTRGRLAEARKEYTTSARLEPSGLALGGIGNASALMGDRARARVLLTALDSLAGTGVSTAYQRAVIYAGLGDASLALEWLALAADRRDPSLAWLSCDRRLNPLRRDPRFARITQRAGLPP